MAGARGRAVGDQVRDILLVVTLAWLPFAVVVAPEETRRRDERATYAQWARALVSCANGGSFIIGRRIVFCDVTDVAEPRP